MNDVFRLQTACKQFCYSARFRSRLWSVLTGVHSDSIRRPLFSSRRAVVRTGVAFGTAGVRDVFDAKYLGNYGRYGVVYSWEPIGKWPGRIEWWRHWWRHVTRFRHSSDANGCSSACRRPRALIHSARGDNFSYDRRLASALLVVCLYAPQTAAASVLNKL